MNTAYAVDLLFESVKAKGPVCIGLDSEAEYVPQSERRKAESAAISVLHFNRAVIDATYDIAACYKVQIAPYEEMGIAGLSAYRDTLCHIRSKRSLIIADIKRGDIAETAKHYAKAHFSGDFDADFATLNPYMGMDTLAPWLKEAEAKGKGAFVLIRTSNPGMKDFECQKLANGKPLYYEIGDRLAELAMRNMGVMGYGIFGAVVGCTGKEEAAEIRERYKNLFFLIPGYGAQGGAAENAALLLREGNGGVVNASRSIITAWQKEEGAENADNSFAAEAARRAAVKMRDDILNALRK